MMRFMVDRPAGASQRRYQNRLPDPPTADCTLISLNALLTQYGSIYTHQKGVVKDIIKNFHADSPGGRPGRCLPAVACRGRPDRHGIATGNRRAEHVRSQSMLLSAMIRSGIRVITLKQRVYDNLPSGAIRLVRYSSAPAPNGFGGIS